MFSVPVFGFRILVNKFYQSDRLARAIALKLSFVHLAASDSLGSHRTLAAGCTNDCLGERTLIGRVEISRFSLKMAVSFLRQPGVSETLCMRVSPCEFGGSFVEPFWV